MTAALQEEQLRQGVIYALTHAGEVRYVGKTVKSPESRLREHLDGARKGDTSHRSRWIRSVNYDVQVQVLEEIIGTHNDLNQAEITWIRACRLLFDCRLTNMTEGGWGGTTNLGRVFSDAVRANMSAAQKLRPPISDETRQKISAAGRGKPGTMTGRKHSAETRKKMRESHLGLPGTMTGRKHTEEARRRMGLSQLGRRHQKETIEKIRAAALARWARQRAE